MKRILITGGPTNEYIDEVMKITNMSSGKMALQLAKYFSDDEYQVTLLITKCIKHPLIDILQGRDNVGIMRFETTDELLRDITTCSELGNYDVIIHSAAVADYKPEFSFKSEDMASEIAEKIMNLCQRRPNDHSLECLEDMKAIVLKSLTNPDCKVDHSTKISSMEPNLTVKLGLTPKIIASLRKLFPEAYICGFKLLENVPEEELVEASVKQIKKCNTNLVFANDLAELRKGNETRLVVTKNGYDNIRVDGPYGIYHLVKIAIGDY